ncbi:Hopanoid-associated phosphorylase [Crenothrix polyspora]|uniref:Hopanoid-associated phosphorylase n=1 Tax=Crenothrix polyspora TaxID=360316 RepID=A0A1R4GZJ3_9GAMM|nr:phosphorylase [Crenothrix polyspora]SJM89423.1 Hopanoid-associated phosphorylase [Crenothrix polyspora]
MITGIVVALPEELATLTEKKIDKGHCVFIAKQLLVVYAGAGCHNAKIAAESLLAKGATHLISWGCAAGLSHVLRPGDLVLADTVMDTDDVKIAIDADWHDHSKQVLSKSGVVHAGCLLTTPHIVAPSKDKKQLHLKTGAIALDMESVAIAKVAQQHGVPFLAIRVIADSVNTSLPRAINNALNDQGEVVLKKLLLSIALNPVEIPRLIKLGLNFRAAKLTLKRIASQLNDVIAVKPGSSISA